MSRTLVAHLLAAAAITTALAGQAPAAAADTTLAQTARPTQIAAGQGTVLYSAWDQAIQRYRLMRVVGGAASAVPVAPSAQPFEADVGPTGIGNPYYVYVRCTTAAGSCDLFTFSPTTGRELRSRVSSPDHDERHPTYWRGRLAFLREYGDAERPRQIVYQRPSPDAKGSLRLPGVPARRCVPGGGCIDPQADFDALELDDRRLAQTAASLKPGLIVGGPRPELYASRTVELRLVDLRTGRSQQLASFGRGEGGQSLTGVALGGGRLFASFTCLGDPGGCRTVRAGIYRYTPATGDWALSPRAPATYGLAVADGATYELRDGGGLECDQEFFGPPEAPRCALIRRDPAPRYSAVRAP